MCGVLVTGCVVKPVDISGASTVAELDRYVGREIRFTGEYQLTKELSISNGRVSIEVSASGTFDTERTATVKGVLQKVEYPSYSPDDAQGKLLDRPFPGVHYYLTPTSSADAGMKERKGDCPPHEKSEGDDESDSIGMLHSPGYVIARNRLS